LPWALLHDRDQGLLSAPTRLQEQREVAALPQLSLGMASSIWWTQVS
jgi:hypothetical protein